MTVPDLPAAIDPATSVAFATAARSITTATRQLHVGTPSFRCPPKVVGVDRAVRRRGRNPSEAVVSVRLKGRAWVAVLADMIEGVVVANQLTSPASDRVRAALWEACGYRVETDTQGARQDRAA